MVAIVVIIQKGLRGGVEASKELLAAPGTPLGPPPADQFHNPGTPPFPPPMTPPEAFRTWLGGA